MATSGNTSWELTRNNIIEAALRKLGVLAEGESANSAQLTSGAEALNSLISLFQTKGMPLWKRTTQTVTPVLSQEEYSITNAVKVAQVVLRYTNTSTQYELIGKSEYDFNQLPQGSVNAGIAVHWYFQPGIENGTLHLWPVPDASMVSQCQILVIKQKEFDGFFAAGETPDFPPYYSDALIYTLASRLAPEYGVPIQERQLLKIEATEFTTDAFNYGDDDGSIFLIPDRRGK